ncbi:MAG: CBS domain-containing protein [Balneolaceae bacterium]
MLIETYIDRELIPLLPSDSLAYARQRMEQAESETFPVVESTTGQLVGLLRLEAIEGESPAETVASVPLSEASMLLPSQFVYDALRTLRQRELSLLPVMDAQHVYLGVVRLQTLLEEMPEWMNLDADGALVEVWVPAREYQLSRVVDIIEQERAKVLGFSIHTPTSEEEPVSILFKLDLLDASPVSQSLRRHGYEVRTESRGDLLELDLSERADELMRFLNV